MRKKMFKTSLAPLVFGLFRLSFGLMAFGLVRLGFGNPFFHQNEGETDSDVAAAASVAVDCSAADLLRHARRQVRI